MRVGSTQAEVLITVTMTLEEARALGTPSVKVVFPDCCAVEREAAVAFRALVNALHAFGVHEVAQ